MRRCREHFVKLPSVCLVTRSLSSVTPWLPGNPSSIFDTSGLTRFSDIKPRRDAIINMARNKANAPHTILLVGGTGVGKSSLVEFIANTILSRHGCYCALASLDSANERRDPGMGTVTVSPHLYEIPSELGVLVSVNFSNVVTGIISPQDSYPRHARVHWHSQC